MEITRDEALAMFLENKFKVELITSLPSDARITVYRVGPMVDLCRGPHIPHTGFLKAVAVTGASRSFWRGDVTKDPLQRVYAITFPDSKLLKEYKHRIEEAKKRDHRVVGPHQELFFFHQLSPGSCFFLPHGGRIYNSLIEFIREKYWEFEYEEARACSGGAALLRFPSHSARSLPPSHGALRPLSSAFSRPRPAARSAGFLAARKLTPPSLCVPTSQRSGHHAQHVQLRPLEDLRPRCALQGQHVRVPG